MLKVFKVQYLNEWLDLVDAWSDVRDWLKVFVQCEAHLFSEVEIKVTDLDFESDILCWLCYWCDSF